MWQTHPYSFLLFLSAGVSLLSFLIIFPSRKILLIQKFSWFLLGSILWNFFYAWDFLFIHENWHLFFLIAKHLGKILCLVAIVLTVIELTQNKVLINRTFWIFIFLSPLLFALGLLFDGYASTFIESTQIVKFGNYDQWVTENGWMTTLSESGLAMVWTGVCCFLLLEFMKKAKRFLKVQVIFYIFSMLFVWVVAITQETGVSLFFGLDVAPIAVSSLSLFSLLLGGYHKFTDIIPLARNTIIDELDDPIVILDYNERVIDWNVSAESLFLNDTSIDSIPQSEVFFQNQPEVFQKLKSFSERRMEFQWIWTQVRPDHSTMHWKVEGKRMKGPSGARDLYGTILIFRNITEQKNSEQSMQESNYNLMLANQSKVKFFSLLSHDLRGPIGGMKTLVSVLNEKLQNKEPDLAQMSHLLVDSADSIGNLLEMILDWAKLQTGKDDFSPENSSLFPLVEECMRLHHASAKNKEISLQNQVAPSVTFWGDSRMILTVLRNLVSNAIKFTPSGGRVWIQASEHPDHWTVSVRDTGVGISEEAIDRLFRISEIPSTSGTIGEKGHGLGLVLCNEFVKRNGGVITVESDLRKGSTFSFTIKKAGNPLGGLK